MDVLFSNPPWFEQTANPFQWRCGVRAGSRWPFTYEGRSAPDRFHGGDYIPFPFFLAYSCTYLAKQGVNVHLRDSIALRESYDSWLRFLALHQPQYVVIESATPSWENDKRCLAMAHSRLPHAKFIVTGPITTTQHEEILNLPGVVACCRGEYEKGVARVVCKGETELIDFDLLTEAEMNAAPFPWLDHMYAARYFDPNPQGQRFPHAQVWSSRGCPFKCCFCVFPAAMTGNDPDGTKPRAVRHYTADYMTAFLTEWRERYRFQSVYFDDDTFNLGDKHTLAMCGVMRKVKLPWSCMCRADTINRETWAEMKDAGCFGVKIGFESGNQYVVDNIVRKHLDLEKAADTVAWLKQLGMTVHGTFTIGLPGETEEQQKDTLAYIRRLYELGMTTHQLSGTACIEGTPLATLLQVGKLERYPGATVEGFDREPDGHKKAEALIS